MPKENGIQLNVSDLSELLILTVLDKLGSASIPIIVKSLATATEKGKAPFVIGPSVELVLKWRETKNEVVEERNGRETFYRVTNQGKLTVAEFSPVVTKLFPGLSHVLRPHSRAAVSR
jgi:hypothetical protein